MTDAEQDYVWHGHHENVCPIELLSGTIAQRRVEIAGKPEHEQATRLRLLKLASPEAIVAFADYEAKHAPLDADYKAKLASLDADYKAKLALPLGPILALHAQECVPDCPWDGWRIVFPVAT